jgi:subtilisin family serine protease
MSRSKLIIYFAVAVGIVLAIVFVSQVKQLKKQVRSSVRIVPGDQKSQENVAQQEIEQGAPPARPDVLVKFRAGVSSDSAQQIIARFNDQLLDEIEAVPGLVAIDDLDNTDAAATAAQYRALPEVEYAEPNYEINLEQPSAATGEKQMHTQWAKQIGLPQAWSKTKGSRDIVVAILDSGIDTSNVDLVNNLWTRPSSLAPYHDQSLGTIDDVHGYNAIMNDGEAADDNGHGTSCAAIVGSECQNNANACGVNPAISLMSLKFLNSGGFGTVANAVEAINYAIDRKHAGVNVRVINVGWGLRQPSRALEDIVRKAGDEGILFVVASGNLHTNNDNQPYDPASYNLENVVSVAAVDRDDKLSSFSNYGAIRVQVAAPGQEILTASLGNELTATSDTSAAAAVVSGVAALALSVSPDLSVVQLRKLLLESVDKSPGLAGKVSTGGRINAGKAVKEPLFGVR